jgi:hypothetical protein
MPYAVKMGVKLLTRFLLRWEKSCPETSRTRLAQCRFMHQGADGEVDLPAAVEAG